MYTSGELPASITADVCGGKQFCLRPKCLKNHYKFIYAKSTAAIGNLEYC